MRTLTKEEKADLELLFNHKGFITFKWLMKEFEWDVLDKLKHIDLSNKDYLLLNNLISKCINENKGFLLGVEDNESNILGGAFFVKTNKRIYYLFSVVTPKGKKDNVATLLIDKIIAENCNSNLTLDFEGSMIDGIASFYKSFGGKPEKYGFLKQNNFSFLFK